MKEDTDTVLNALLNQQDAVRHAINNAVMNLRTNPCNAVVWEGIVSANEQEITRLDAEIERRTRPRLKCGAKPRHRDKTELLRALLHQGTPKKQAAKQLGIARSTLYRLLAFHG